MEILQCSRLVDMGNFACLGGLKFEYVQLIGSNCPGFVPSKLAIGFCCVSCRFKVD
jgi:hypothetical protein